MIKRILVGMILAVLISNCFAGYSGGGRSGFSGGRSFSSSRSSSYSIGRSGYARSTRAYVTPRAASRSYARSSSNTVIHNNHYSHGGYGYGGGGFFNGFLGGYLGGSMANAHNPVIVAGNAGGVVQGQGMLMEGAAPYAVTNTLNPFGFIIAGIFCLFLLLLFFWASVSLYRLLFGKNRDRSHNRW